MSNSHSNKRIAKNTILLYLRMFVSVILGFYTSRIVLEALGVEDYGIYNVVGGIVGVLSILNHSMAGTVQRWITIALGKEDTGHLKKVFSVSLSAQAVIAVLIFLGCETVGLWYLNHYAVIPVERLAASFWVFHISLLTVVLQVIKVPFDSAIMAHERMGAYALFSITDVLIKLIICLLIGQASCDRLILYAVLLFVGYILNFVWMLAYSYKNFAEARLLFAWDLAMYKEMLRLAFWSFTGSVAYIGYTQGIILLINLFFGPAMNAAAGLAGQASNIVNQFSRNFQVAMSPQITKNYAKNNFIEMNQLVFRSSKFSYFLMLLFALPLFFESEILLTFWLKTVPAHTVGYLRIGLITSMLFAIRNPLITSSVATGDIRRFQLSIIKITLCVVPVSYLILYLGGIPETPAIVLAVAILLTIFVSAYQLRKMTALDYKLFCKDVLLKILLVSVLSAILPFIIVLKLEPSFLRLCISSFIAILSSSVAIYLIGLSQGERTFIKTVIYNRLSRTNIRWIQERLKNGK